MNERRALTDEERDYLAEHVHPSTYTRFKKCGFGTEFSAFHADDNRAWKLFRRLHIGGSDVAAIMGLSPWKTPLEVWMEKTGRLQEDDLSDNEAVYWGTVNEAAIAKRFARDHYDLRVYNINATLVRGQLAANLDRLVLDVDNEPAVLEVKTASAYKADEWADGVPIYYQTQVQHYLRVTGWQKAYVAVLIGGNDYREYVVERDEQDIAAMRKATDTFIEFIKEDRPPKVVGTSSELKAMAADTEDASGYVDMGNDSHVDGLVADYQDLSEQAQDIARRKTKVAAELAQIIGDNKGITTDTAKVTFVRREVHRFDTKRFAKEDPETYSKFVKTTVQSGGIKIKEFK